MGVADARKASGAMAPVAIRVSVTLVGRATPSSGSLSIRLLPRRDRSFAGPRFPVLHPQISPPIWLSVALPPLPDLPSPAWMDVNQVTALMPGRLSDLPPDTARRIA